MCTGWFYYLIFVILNMNFYTVDYNKIYFTGPFGEQDDEQVFVQKVVPETDQLFVRLASNGKRYFLLLINLQLNFELWCAEEAGRAPQLVWLLWRRLKCFVQSVACSLYLPHFPSSIHLCGCGVYTPEP